MDVLFNRIHIYPGKNKLPDKIKTVRLFYDVLWNEHDKTVIPLILYPDLSFRGSLGEEKSGHKGFEEYMDSVHHALGGFKCEILDTVSEEHKLFAKMDFSGVHQNELFGYGPTNRQVSWNGAALFTFEDGLIKDLWVLGDIYGLLAQLKS